MERTVLYISMDGLSDPLGQSQILPYLIGFARKGIGVHVISCEKVHLSARSEKIGQQLAAENIQWHRVSYNPGGGFFSRLSYFFKLKRIAFGIVRSARIDLVHCRSYIPALVGLSVKKKFSVPFIFDMRGFWADERVDGGIWRKSNPLHLLLYRYFKNRERVLIRKAGWIISLTQAGMSELQKLYVEAAGHRVTVIPCCVDLHHFNPASHSPRAVEGLLPNDRVLVYCGSVGTWYCLRETIDCVATWKQAIPHLRLLAVTKDKAALEKLLADCPESIRRMVVIAPADHSEVPAYLARAEASIFFIRPAYSKKASSPTRMAESWAMGLPVITNVGIGDSDFFVDRLRGGILVSEFSNDAYRDALDKYLSIDRSPDFYRDLAGSYFDQTMGLKQYLEVYRRLWVKGTPD